MNPLKCLLPLAGLCLPLFSLAADAQPDVFKGSIERHDPKFDELVAPDAAMEKIAEGFNWSEGPVWYQNTLLFSDVPENVVHQWKPGARSTEVFLKPSGLLTPTPGFREPGSNGLAVDAEGRLLLAQHGERRIARYADGKFASIADRYDGKRFNSPNDLAVRKSGEIYFTDPPYGLDGGDKSALKELDWHGVYRVANDGKVTLLTKSIRYPNGIAFSPDEKVLYIGVSDGKASRIVALDVKADGSVENERVFYDAEPRKAAGYKGGCDGLKVDRDGNVWASGPGGIVILSPAGKLLGALNTGQYTANCGWGDDGSTLYITADMFMLRLKTKTKGAGW